jgi:hypothetical protein
MNDRMSEKELTGRLAQLPREISPEHDPWPEIAARIEQAGSAAIRGRSERVWWVRAVAAAAVIAIAAGLLFSMQPNGLSIPGQGPAQQARDAGPGQGGLPGILAGSEVEYLAAFREFIPLGHSRAVLPLQTVEKIEMGWADLLNTETALAAALEEHPNDPFLNERMLELRARQLGFLKQLATLDSSNRRMTI